MKKIITLYSLVLVCLLACYSVNASEYRVNELRECIVKKCSYKKELDYNGDKKIDILDILETRKTENVQYDEVIKNQGPGFGEITGTAAQGIGQTTTKSTKKTTTKRKTTKKTTTRKTTTKKGTTTKKTTTKKTTTNKITTNKTTTAKNQYNITVTGNNATVDATTKQGTSGSKVTFTFTPETGYSYSSVTCTNGAKGTYNKDTNKLAVNYIKGDTSCTVVFKKVSYAVTIKATNGTVGDSKIYVEVGGLSKATVKPKTGYQFSTVTCTNGLTASYAGEQLTVGNATKTGTCTVKFVPQQFLVIIKDNAGNNYLEGKYDYKSTKATFSIKTTTRLNKQVTCNGTVYTASEYSSTSGGVKIYKYSVGFPVTSNVTCTYTIR